MKADWLRPKRLKPWKQKFILATANKNWRETLSFTSVFVSPIKISTVIIYVRYETAFPVWDKVLQAAKIGI